jgi:hypothetical protein
MAPAIDPAAKERGVKEEAASFTAIDKHDDESKALTLFHT